jgi:WD40 repeat protein
MAFSPDEKILLTVESSQSAKQNSLRLLDLATGKSLCEPYPTDGFSQAGFARDGKTFATRLRSGLQFWETQTGKPLGQPVLPNIPIFNLVFDPTSKAVVVTTQTQGALLIPVPQTLGADAERIRLWVEVATHQELDVAGGAVDLDPKTWQQRWQRLRELGGAP